MTTSTIDLFPSEAARRCTLCDQPFTRGCAWCEIRGTLPPPSPQHLAAIDAADRRAAARLHRLRSLERPVRVGLVGCAQQKRPGTHPARELYVSPLFRYALSWAERSTDETFILSARYGLVHPDQILDHYDQRLPARHGEAALWGLSVANHLATLYPSLTVTVVFLAGLSYVEPIVTALPKRWTIEDPLAGLGIGHRLSFLRRALQDSSP
jgi:hypothetical protein